ncbi:unnamed protein product [Schistocephalus solidus]|uniref:Uncharacterized protein n=1 Tax=Schistocephalus solidus TaxID=70667 RepID=A0A183SE25_SCHSO|nr:unnamed protein product [Schistocephalus solidus]
MEPTSYSPPNPPPPPPSSFSSSAFSISSSSSVCSTRLSLADLSVNAYGAIHLLFCQFIQPHPSPKLLPRPSFLAHFRRLLFPPVSPLWSVSVQTRLVAAGRGFYYAATDSDYSKWPILHLNLDYSTEPEVHILEDPQHQYSAHLNGLEHQSEQVGADEHEFALTAEATKNSSDIHASLEGSKQHILADERQIESQALVEEAIADAEQSRLREEPQQEHQEGSENIFLPISPFGPGIPAVEEGLPENGAETEHDLPDPHLSDSFQTEEFLQEPPSETFSGFEGKSQPAPEAHTTEKEKEEPVCEHHSQSPSRGNSQVSEPEDIQPIPPEGGISQDLYQQKEEEFVASSDLPTKNSIHENEEDEKKEEPTEPEPETFEQQQHFGAEIEEIPPAPLVSAPIILAADCEATPEAPPLEEVEHTFGEEGETSTNKPSEMASVEFVNEGHRYVPEHCGPEAYDHAHHERAPGDEVEHYELGPAIEHPQVAEPCNATTQAIAINEALPMPVPVYQAQFEPHSFGIPTLLDAPREHEGYQVEEEEEEEEGGHKTFQDIRQDLEKRK